MSKALKNTLVVVADCLRADAVPDSFKKGAVYANAWACGSATIPAFASLYTGLLPHEHGHVTRHATPAGTMLPDRCPDHNPYVVTENPFSRWAGELHQADGAGAQDIIDNLPPSPWLVIYHSMVTHWPYGGIGHEHKHFYKENDKTGLPILTQLYMGGVQKLIDLVLDLEQRIKPDVTILTADHGDGMMEHGFFGHPAGRMFPPLLHVPLIVRDKARKYTYKAPFSMAGFPQLVVAVATLGKRVRAIPGEECYSSGYRESRPRVASIRQNDTLVIASATRQPMQFDLLTDPLAQSPSREVGALLPVLHEVQRDLKGIEADALTVDEAAEVTRRLEALGYV